MQTLPTQLLKPDAELRKNNPVKILMVISEAPPIKSGIARVGEKLTAGLRARGHQVDVLSQQDIPRWQFGEIRISSMPLKLRAMREQLCNYDLIHLHGPVPTFSDVFLLAGLKGLGETRPRLVYTHHAPIYLHQLWLRPFLWAYNAVQERMARLADHVVVSTQSYGKRLSRYVPLENLTVIPWGVDFNDFKAPVEKTGPFTVLYLGQMRPYKGLPVLLRAAEGLENVRLWVIGDGHEAANYQALAGDLKLADVRFWGRLPDMKVRELMKQVHVMVLPSITPSEAFGIVLLEGMAAGQVPVASSLPGVADLVGSEGFTFPPGDHRALRKLIIRLEQDEPLRLHLAEIAQTKARMFSWERVVYAYERIYLDTLGLRGAEHYPEMHPYYEMPTVNRLPSLQEDQPMYYE